MDKYKLLESSEFWKYLGGYMDNEAIIKLPKVPLAIAFKHHTDKIKENYDERFLKLVGEMQGLMFNFGDKEASMINSALHEFDKDTRKIFEKG